MCVFSFLQILYVWGLAPSTFHLLDIKNGDTSRVISGVERLCEAVMRVTLLHRYTNAIITKALRTMS
jgi:hypothetical protein